MLSVVQTLVFCTTEHNDADRFHPLASHVSGYQSLIIVVFYRAEGE